MPNWNKKIQDILGSIQQKPVEYWFYLFLLGILFLTYLSIGFFATRIFQNGNAFRDANFGLNQLKAWRFRDFSLVILVFLLILIGFRGLKNTNWIFFRMAGKKTLAN